MGHIFNLNFLSEYYKINFRISGNSDDKIFSQLIDAIFSMFVIQSADDDKELKVEALKKYDSKCKSEIDSLIIKYSEYLIQINQLREFFKPLKEGDYFMFLPNLELPEIEYFKYGLKLQSLNKKENYDELLNDFNTHLGQTLASFSVRVYGDRKLIIRSGFNRKCRFCGLTDNETRFKNKAHAISEALGNKLVFQLDECDTCNYKFGQEIEPHLLSYLSFYRTLFGIKGKKGKKTIKGTNFEMRNEDDTIHFKLLKGNFPEFSGNAYKIKLDGLGILNHQLAYKGLTKFFLSLVDVNELKKFESTKDWLNEEIIVDKLPRIAIRQESNVLYKHPIFSIFIRNSDNFKLPYAFCEFRFTILRMIYIIPLCVEDKLKFIEDDEYDLFWSNLHFRKGEEEWAFEDFSINRTRKLNWKLNSRFKDNLDLNAIKEKFSQNKKSPNRVE